MINVAPFEISIAASGLGHVTRGIETWAVDVALALREQGIEAGLFSGSGVPQGNLDRVVGCIKRDSLATKTLVSAFPKRLRWRFGYGSPYSIEQTTFSNRLIRQLNSHHVRLLHVQDPLVARAVQQAFEAGKCSTRVVLGHGTEEPLDFLRQITYVQQLAPWHLEQSLTDQSFNSSARAANWVSIPNFVDTDQFHPGKSVELRDKLEIPREALVILCAAAIKRVHKRIDYLIDEFESLLQTNHERPVWLVVAGASEPDTQSLIKAGLERLGERVRFLVATPRDEMPKLFRMADVFTLTSLYEMMPIALLEAISSGLPCIVNDHPVLRWMAGPGGIPSDLAESGGWANAAAALCDDASLRTRLATAAREHCLQNFAKGPVVEQLVRYYADILGQAKRKTAA